MNQFKTLFLLVLMSVVLMLIGGAIGGKSGIVIALLISLFTNYLSYYFSDKIVLSMYGAKEVGEGEAPELIRMVRSLSERAGIPMPRVYVIPSSSPNAFATGRDPAHSAIAFTQGILQTLDYGELEAVAAHELSHVKNRDTLVMTVAATLASAIGFLAYMARFAAIFGGGNRRGGGLELLVWAIIAPLIALMIQMAISRAREFQADDGSAHITGQPLQLASALAKITSFSQIIPQDDLANPSTAHLWIANPISSGFIGSLFSTHPPVEVRIRRLRKMAGVE